MTYRLLADLVALLHLAFILFALLGGLLALRWRWAPWVHLPAMAWGALLEIRRWSCPLTPLEKWLRTAAGGAAYPGGFIEHHLTPLLYPGWLTRRTEILLAAILLAVNVAVYSIVWRRAVRRSRSAPP